MTHRPTYLTRNFLVTSCFALTCMVGAAPGCGSSEAGGVPQVDSNLLGIYQVDRFQSSPECGELMDVSGAPRLVLYSASLNDDPEVPVLAGQFCGSVDDCRARASALSGAVNYSFFEGSDEQGWEGTGIASQSMAGEQCRVEVQVHTMTSSSDQAIRIDTEQVETTYAAMLENDVATCSIRAAIESVDEDSPCTGLFLLEATFEAGL